MKNKRLNAALDRLAALIPNGELMLTTDPATLIEEVCDRLEYLKTTVILDLTPSRGEDR